MKREVVQASLVGSVALALAASLACGGGGGAGGGGSIAGPSGNRWELSGVVRGPSDAPLAGATVEILDGPNAAQSVTTSTAGAYSLPSLVQGGFTVRAAKRGYVAVARGITLTANTTADFTLAQDQPAVSIAFDPETIPTFPSGNRVRPVGLRFVLRVTESHYVDVNMTSIVFRLTSSRGEVAWWSCDTEEFRERYGSLVLRGGQQRLLDFYLVYDGEQRGTLGAWLQSMGPDGALYTATGTATVVTGAGASASSLGPAVRPLLPGGGSRR